VSIVLVIAVVWMYVSVEQEMGLVELDGLERLAMLVVVLGMNMLMAVAAVFTVLDALHVNNLISSGHRGQPVPMVSPFPHSQA